MLMTAAPRLIASPIWDADRPQLISSGSGTLSARAPGQMPTVPTPLTGAAATDMVAVPCVLVTGYCSIASTLPPTHSACVLSSWASTSAISGLFASTAGGDSAGSTTQSRQSSGGADSGSPAPVRSGAASVSGCA